jgi:hypothetical protein
VTAADRWPGADRDTAGPGEVIVPAGRSGPAIRVPPLLHDALTALDADLGKRCLGWAAFVGPDGRTRKRQVYRPRLELLAEALDPVTFQVVLGWLSSARRTSVATRRGYCDDLLAVWAPLACELGHSRFFVGCLTTAHLQMWRSRVTGRLARPLTPRSIARYVKTLSSLRAYAAGVLDPPPVNPVIEDIRPVIDEEAPSTATPILEEAEVAAVLAAATPPGPTGRAWATRSATVKTPSAARWSYGSQSIARRRAM